MNASHIEINGKKYDARTGKLIHSSTATVQASPARPKPTAHTVRTAPKQVHKTTQRSQTLMRHAVKKPGKPSAAKPKATTVMADIAAPVQTNSLTPKFYHQTDAQREERARKIKRSNLVSRFSDFTAPLTGNHSAPAHHVDRPVPSRVEPLPVRPAPAAHMIRHNRPAESMLEKGLRAATSHTEQTPKTRHTSKKSKRARLVSFGAGGMAVLLLGAFFAYQNIPQISMRYAAARSGVQAQLPDYRPSGFALNSHIQYNPGQITLSFKSNADDRNFTITQRSSTWNSETLMSNYVAQASDQVQTYEDRGRTIYLYGDSNATWVNAGVWYDINGNSQLNSDQLVRIATSM